MIGQSDRRLGVRGGSVSTDFLREFQVDVERVASNQNLHPPAGGVGAHRADEALRLGDMVGDRGADAEDIGIVPAIPKDEPTVGISVLEDSDLAGEPVGRAAIADSQGVRSWRF